MGSKGVPKPGCEHINKKMNTADLIGIFGVVCYQIAYAGMQLGCLGMAKIDLARRQAGSSVPNG
jgi:hypothetical protein